MALHPCFTLSVENESAPHPASRQADPATTILEIRNITTFLLAAFMALAKH